MYGFAQVPCPRCNTVVQIAQQVGYGVCPTCQNQVSAGGQPMGMPMGGQPQQPMGGQPMGGQPMGMQMPPTPMIGAMAHPAMQGRSGFPLRIVGAAVLAAFVGAGWFFVRTKIAGPGKGKATYSAIGVDANKPDADKMITSVSGLAKKWRSDAIWWSVNFQEVHADGTVNVSNGAVVEYISPSKVSSVSKKVREDSIKKFSFGPSAVDYSKQWNALKQWKGVDEPATPQCSIHDLAKKLEPKGLKGTKTVRVSFDPQFDWGDEPSWHVTGDDPKIDARFSMKSCEEVGAVKDGGHTSSDDE